MSFVPLTLRAANDFVEQHHRHSARTSNDGGKFALGFEDAGQLVAVAIVGRPIGRFLDDGVTAEALRVCASKAAPMGTCPKLYERCDRIWKLMGGRRIVSYTLKRESGATLRAAGWIVTGEVEGGQWDVPSRPRAHKAIHDAPKWRWEAVSLASVGRGVRFAWSAGTSYWPDRWSKANPAAGQCAVTAAAVQKWLGGVIVAGEAGGESHYWNRIDGADIDLTRSQFAPGTAIAETATLEGIEGDADFQRRFALLDARMTGRPISLPIAEAA